MAAKGIEQRRPFLLCQRHVVLSVIDHGPGLTAMAQTSLPKLHGQSAERGSNTIQLYCLWVEKFAFWLVIYINTFNTVNNKTSTLSETRS